MTFAGAKFLFPLVGASIGIFAAVFFYGLVSNIFFTIKTGTGAKVFVLILALALGGAASFFGFKFAKKFAVEVVAGLAGAMGLKLLMSLFGVMNTWAQIAAMIVGAVGGFFVGKKFEFWV